MIRIATQRVGVLFALADREARTGSPDLSDRYVQLARRIGMKYNVRMLPEYRTLFCQRCSAYWTEGRTVRTRLRGGLRVQTCLRCGSLRRVRLHPRSSRGGPSEDAPHTPGSPEEPTLAEEPEGFGESLEGEEE
jgi:ribonuclease P protein subunit RPR2